MPGIFEVGSFRLDTEAGVLTRDGNPVALGPRAVSVLALLVECAGQYVPKSRIIDAVWSGLVVEEENLRVQIAAVRRALAQPGGGRWIETLPRRGYRFVGPVRELTNGERAAALTDRRSNLPQPATSFIGRGRELAEIKRLLPGNRLLTITGAGGIGKTRLALQAGAEVVDAYRDGVWLVELGAIRDPALVPAAVAQALGVHESRGTPPMESLLADLEAREILLVVDNCEHLLESCAQLAEALLGGAKGVTILATSREPMHLSGEQTYTLQPLSLPDAGAKLDAVRCSEAVQLFVERVQRQLPDFELTPDRASVVAEICIHLDGIPLALELAAARARSLAVEQINARLAQRFKLLTAGSRAALPRQQTLRATLDWSYDLLGEDERVVLRRLGVFPGDFAIEAACAVASDGPIDEYAVIDLLSQLVARSLVIAETGALRYRLLETTRAYGLEKLAEAEETDAVRGRHARFFRDFFEPALDDRLGKPAAAWRARYLPEVDNVRAALDWALGSGGDAAIGVALAGGSGELWGMLGLFGEGIRRLAAAVGQIGEDTPEPERARLWLWLGRLVDEAPAEACAAFERAAELYRRCDDALGLAHALVRLGRVLAFMGRLQESESALEEVRSLLEPGAPPRLLSLYCAHSAFLKTFAGDLAGARAHYERALAIDREHGDEFGMLATIGNLANVNWALGDLNAAAAAMLELVALMRGSPVRTRRLLGYALTNLAGILTERGDLGEALAAAREGLPLVREDGSAWIFADHMALRMGLAAKLSDAARLAGYAEHAWKLKKATRQPNEARARKRLLALLREKLTAEELERLLAEGAKMSEEEACRLALED